MESQFGSHSSLVDMEAHVMSMVLDKSHLIANNIIKTSKIACLTTRSPRDRFGFKHACKEV